jgi:hypothetical protein
MTKSRVAIMATAAFVATLAAAVSVRAGSDRIAFPNDYAKGVIYKTEDRAENKQVRELFITREAVEAVRRGAPLPSGTVITSVRYAPQLDAEGNPVKDANGRFIKTDKILGYTVKEKRAGWGAEYPDETRNGEWEYRVFRADKTANPETSTMLASAATSRSKARITCLLTTTSKQRHALNEAACCGCRAQGRRWITLSRRRAA